jgi:hypothetical protein
MLVTVLHSLLHDETTSSLHHAHFPALSAAHLLLQTNWWVPFYFATLAALFIAALIRGFFEKIPILRAAVIWSHRLLVPYK